MRTYDEADMEQRLRCGRITITRPTNIITVDNDDLAYVPDSRRADPGVAEDPGTNLLVGLFVKVEEGVPVAPEGQIAGPLAAWSDITATKVAWLGH